MPVKSQRGFSIIDLLVSMAIVGILLAVAVPSFRKAKMAANEASAAATVRTVAQAENAYFQMFGSYSPDLSSLGGVDPCNSPSAGRACLVDSRLSLSHMKGGYYFDAAGSAWSPANSAYGFEVNATPMTFGLDGMKSFCADQTETMRWVLPASANPGGGGMPIGTAGGSCMAIATVQGASGAL